MHYLAAFAPFCFFLGAALHFWNQIDGIVSSSKVPEIQSFGQYVRRYKSFIAARVFGSSMLFCIVYGASGLVGLDLPAATPLVARVGLAGFAGLSVDRGFVELQNRFGLFKGAVKDLPTIGGDQAQGKGAGE